MESGQIIILIILCCITIVMLFFYGKQKHPVKSALFGSISGVCSFIGIKLLFGAAGLILPLNLFTFWTSAALGIPGAIALSILQIL